MKKKLRTLLVGGLILLIIAAIIIGCGSKKLEVSSKENNNIQTLVEAGKPSSLKFAINVGLKTQDDFTKWRQEYIKKTGINLDFNFMDVNEYYQNIELGFASGDTPDVFTVGNDKIAVYAGQGALLDITEMVENSKELSAIDPALLESMKIDGKLYGVPFEGDSGTITYVRKDWLDQLGMEIPTNYEQYIEMLRGFKSLGDDIIPFTAPGLVADQAEYYLREFYQDASPEFVKDKNGKWVDGMTQPNMIAALERLRDAYAEGLIDVEIVTNKTSTCRDKWYAGKVGTFPYWAGNWYANLEKRVQANVPEAQVIPIPAIEETKYIKRVPAVLAVSSLSKNPEGAFKYIIEYANDGAEGSTLFQHGVEGVHFKYGENGEVISLPKISRPEEVYEKAFISPVLAITKITTPGYAFEVDERISQSNAILDENSVQAEIIPLSSKLSKISEELLMEKEKTVASIVMGQVSVEEGLANYATRAKNLGIDQVIEELNANN